MIPLYTYWIADFAVYFYTLYLISIPGRFTDDPLYFVLTCYTVAHSGAINMVVGHEMLHRRRLVHKICGNLTYAKFMYPHYLI